MTQAGHRIVDSNSYMSHQCNGCGQVKLDRVKLLQCSECKMVKYCSRACKKKHWPWPDHKGLCTAISHLSNKAEPKTLDPNDSTFVSHLIPRQHAVVVGLVGKRCTVKGEINGHSVDVLCDTGAKVLIISNDFLRGNLSGNVVKDISELLNIELNLTAANGSEMPYIGWVEQNFRLLSYENDLKVPFLVTEQHLDSPLIGFHVIEESNGEVALSQAVTSSFPDPDSRTASIFVNFIKNLNLE